MKKRIIIHSAGYAYVPKEKKEVQENSGTESRNDTMQFDALETEEEITSSKQESVEIGHTILFETLHYHVDKQETKLEKKEYEQEVQEDVQWHHDIDEDEERKEPLFVKRTKQRPFVLRVILMVIGMLLVLLMALGFAGVGALTGLIRAYINTTPPLNVSLILEQDQISSIYDANGNFITSYMAYENREWAKSDEIPDMLKNAFIAVEDVRFYQHNGVDIKRLAGVGVGVLTNDYDGGGSTITQQLIKVQVLGSEQSYKRKVQEAYLALELEKMYSKSQILEAYLNAIHLGGSNYGVKAAAEDYFGKSMDQLTIRECAMIAGLTQNPNAYNPRKNMYVRKDMTRTDERTDTVLRRMYTAGFITKEQYENALQEKVTIIEESKIKQMYDMPAFVEYAMYDVITQMLRQRNLQDNKSNRDMIEKEIRVGGYHIYTTVDPDMQNMVQNTIDNWDDYPKLRNPALGVVREVQKDDSVIETVQPQVAATIIDYHTGYVKAMVGRRGEAPQLKLLNRAYNTKMEVGSSIKPLSVYAPALEAGANPGTGYMNTEAIIPGYGGEKGYPLGGGSSGLVSMREGVTKSLNIVTARVLFESVGIDRSRETLINLGIDPSGINADGPGLALGTTAVSPLEMAAAYGAIANAGTYIEPIAFTKVLDKDGNTVLDSASLQERRSVFQPATAWMMTNMLEDAVNEGTGTKAKISNMPTAGKTGTNADYRSVYFVGYTPYYVSSLWIGHDSYKEEAKLQQGSTGGAYAAPLWQAYMEPLHAELPTRNIMDKTANQLGLVEREVCALTGEQPTDDCPTVTDWVRLDQYTTDVCKVHYKTKICLDSGKIATSRCPNTAWRNLIIMNEDSRFASLSKEEAQAIYGSNAIVGINRIELEQLANGGDRYGEYYCTMRHVVEEPIIIPEEVDDSSDDIVILEEEISDSIQEE